RFTDSPRLRLRLALPDSQTRLASGCGSHYQIHRLASPPAAARTTRFTDSPRLRLRLALPDSQTRLASGCGSHYQIHRLASPPAAARATTFTATVAISREGNGGGGLESQPAVVRQDDPDPALGAAEQAKRSS